MCVEVLGMPADRVRPSQVVLARSLTHSLDSGRIVSLALLLLLLLSGSHLLRATSLLFSSFSSAITPPNRLQRKQAPSKSRLMPCVKDKQ